MSVCTVVFDIGNVLVEWRPEAYFDEVIGSQRRSALFAAVDLFAMNEGVDLGRSLAEVVADAQAEHPDFADEIALWQSGWAQMFSPEIPGSVALLHALRAKGQPVIALSNFGDETFESACGLYPFLNEFDQRYISGHVGMIKPDPSFYELVEAGCDHGPEGFLFTDDRPENIAAAHARGWRTHHFTGPEGWAACLVGHGLLTPAEAGVAV